MAATTRTGRTEPLSRFDFHFHRDGAVRREVLVAREREAAPASALLLKTRPAEALGRRIHDVDRARILEVPQPEIDRIGLRRSRELVHEAFDREHVVIRAERAQRGHAQRHRGHEVVNDARVLEAVDRNRVAIAAAGRQRQRLGRRRRERRFDVPRGREVPGGRRDA